MEELGYFYDTIHGRVAFGELPSEFQPALKAALSSDSLDRLTRVSQLGHTSLTYFSATQTRFSHAIGTLLMMNRLHLHLWPNMEMTDTLVKQVRHDFKEVLKLCHDPSISIRCHLLLAALYQDCGELPFQKVTSLYFRPHPNEVDSLQKLLPLCCPADWKTKDVFTLRALADDLKDAGLNRYDLRFLAFLMTGDGKGGDKLQSLRQMVDGTIDADRLDYVFRDALLTIGSLGSAEAVLRSIIGYERDHVVVNDPRPAVDFLSTRARLWTFVYASPDVRFRQTMLRSFLQAGFASKKGRQIFSRQQFNAELTLAEFLRLDDHSMLRGLRSILEGKEFDHLPEPGRNACEGLLKTVTDYECRILPKPKSPDGISEHLSLEHLPNDLFFDLLLDHDEEHKLYLPKSVRVQQLATATSGAQAASMALEECSGSLSPIFSAGNRAPLVRDSFLVFRPKKVTGEWDNVEQAIGKGTLYEALAREDIRREVPFLDDTWNRVGYRGLKIAISCSFRDRPTVVRVIKELQAKKQRYRVLLDSLVGLGRTTDDNSRQLIRKAEGILVLGSRDYVLSATSTPGGNIDTEVSEIYSKNIAPERTSVPVVVFAVDPYDVLKSVPLWAWSKLHPAWKTGPPILFPTIRHASDTTISTAVEGAIGFWNERKK